MTRTLALSLVVAVAALLSPRSAHAATISVFTNVADWQAALGGSFATEDFSGATIRQTSVSAVVDGLTDDLSIRGTAGGATIEQGQYKDYVAFGPGFGGPEDATLFTFGGSGVSAFGADWDLGQVFGGIMLRMRFFDGTEDTATIVNPFSGAFAGFFGIVVDGAIGSIQLSTVSGATTAGQSFTLDNVNFVPTPEPVTGILTGIGILVGAVSNRRRRRRRQVQLGE